MTYKALIIICSVMLLLLIALIVGLYFGLQIGLESKVYDLSNYCERYDLMVYTAKNLSLGFNLS